LQAAAALIAAAASGGDPEIANKIIEKMMSGRRRKQNTIRNWGRLKPEWHHVFKKRQCRAADSA
jgi:hypothetical protein